MKRIPKKESAVTLGCGWTRLVDENIENFKRRRAVSPFTSLDDETRAFFEKMVSVRRIKDFAFLRREDSRGH